MTVQKEDRQVTESAAPKKPSEVFTEKVQRLVHEGNARRIVVKDTQDRVVLDVPVNAGIVAAVFAPVATAAGTITALAGPWSIAVERRGDPPTEEKPS
ncbi:DUF4342 domain-containing protein [Amycolatopsis regifaucium]|uniref:Ubiquitin-associated-domain-containing protein n=1 Tax=Amycolatopsis regifaucium TaxID=546365 RepID=A0A154MP01_9PSEU|nr:DUF4342 domain-containing protein [Amycolatopsis regifaucium]KZB85810.1 ubiquitin-associated- domain-containing protein [Amycolatopsis regifaucium]OKA10435.1 ubiquitin-associated- domain-containing protein [Amycolatopsis regifaucium]SFI76802.1 protein of unknown function [Amycolatopsis regifaucium]